MDKNKIIQRFLAVVTLVWRWTKRPYAVFILGALLGGGFFALFYGLKVVNPAFTDWLMVGEDLKQHFLGWEFYRSEAWSVPLGEIHQLAYPFGISVTYMDSIPLMAIPFKLFAGVLPENFQYFGLWGLLCFMLQGGFAAIIMRRWTKNIFVILLCATIFVVSPLLLARMFTHTALAGQWILLAAIWVFLERDRIKSVLWQVVVWSTLLVLAVLVHPYFLPMVALPFALSLVLQHKRWIATLVKAFVPVIVALAVFWLIGGLMVAAGDAIGGGLGSYQLNMDSLFNPLGWSLFIRPLHDFTGESLMYLGGGMLFLVPIGAWLLLGRVDTASKVKRAFEKINVRHVLVALLFLGLIALALSPRIYLGKSLLVELPVPQRIEAYWGIFQASARLFWVVYYMIIVGLLALLLRAFRHRLQIILIVFLSLIVCVQVLDIQGSPAAKQKQARFTEINRSDYAYSPKVTMASWDMVATGKQHLIYLDDMNAREFFMLSDVALKHRLTMNTGYFARAPQKEIQRLQGEMRVALQTKKADLASNIFIFKNEALAVELRSNGYDIQDIDGFYVVR